MKIKIKPISINACWQGKRFKTKEYADWRDEFSFLMLAKRPKLALDESKCLRLVFGLKRSVRRLDLDNMIKPTLDALVENGIIEDDRLIYCLEARKMQSDEEFISFEFK